MKTSIKSSKTSQNFRGTFVPGFSPCLDDLHVTGKLAMVKQKKKQFLQKKNFTKSVVAEEKLHQIFETLLSQDFLRDKGRKLMVMIMRMILRDQKFLTGLARGQKQRVSAQCWDKRHFWQKTSANSYNDDKDEKTHWVKKKLVFFRDGGLMKFKKNSEKLGPLNL